MIPSVFVTLDAMQLTSSGKVDRRALPAPDRMRPELKGGYVSPRSPLEETLAAIWTAVLGVERIGIHDNFFELGGHSLRAAQVISHLRNIFKIDLPLQRLFESPTVAGLAEHVQSALSCRPAGDDHLFCSPYQEREIFPSPSRSSGFGSWTGGTPAVPSITSRWSFASQAR